MIDDVDSGSLDTLTASLLRKNLSLGLKDLEGNYLPQQWWVVLLV